MRAHPNRDPYPTVLARQIRLAEARRADVAALAADGAERELEVLVDAIANDLAGARLVMRAALSAPPPSALSGASREALELRERETTDLLRVVAALLPPRTR